MIVRLGGNERPVKGKISISTFSATTKPRVSGARRTAENGRRANHMSQSYPHSTRLCAPPLVIAIAAAMLGACAPEMYPKQRLGTLVGAAGGAYAGTHFSRGRRQLAATAAGTLLGALVGGNIGRSLDRADILYLQRAHQQALEFAPSGRSARWQNPHTGHSGAVTLLRTYHVHSGAYCRAYRTTVTIGGWIEEAHGTACRQTDGSWMVVGN